MNIPGEMLRRAKIQFRRQLSNTIPALKTEQRQALIVAIHLINDRIRETGFVTANQQIKGHK